jgi:hypothetical protein
MCCYLLLQLAGGGPVGASSSASASGYDQGQGARAGGGSQPCHARAVAALPSVEAEAAVLLARAGPALGGGMPPVAVTALHVLLRTHTWSQAPPVLDDGNRGSGGGVGPPPRFPIIDVALDLGALPSLRSLVIHTDWHSWWWGHQLLPWPSVACKGTLWRPRLSAALLGGLTRLELGAQHTITPALLDGALVAELVCLVGGRRQKPRVAVAVWS